MKNNLVGEKINLRPSTIKDREKIFNWLTNSNLTREMIGPPNFPDSKIPSWEEFKVDYYESYFTGSHPTKGQCFIIELNGTEIGQINHNSICSLDNSTDLDIWLSDIQFTGKGYGTDAILTICSYLNQKYGCKRIKISPSKRNLRAIKAYRKAGFKLTNEKPEKAGMDYIDNIIFEKIIE